MSRNAVRLLRSAWLGLAALGATLYAWPMFVHWNDLQRPCPHPVSCPTYQIDLGAIQTLHAHGFSPEVYALAIVIGMSVPLVISYLMGGLIVLKKAGDRGALVTAFLLAIFPIWGATIWIPLDIGSYLSSFFIAVLLLFCLLFPNGRFEPRWTRRLALADLAACILLAFPISSVMVVPVFAAFIATIWAQIDRYRRVSSWAERQETKWAVLGLAVALLGMMAIFSIYGFTTVPQGSLFQGLSNPLLALVMTAIPVSLAIAVLRSRLWDIDRVISHSLAYLLLTASLIGIYAGSVIGIQALLRTVTGQQSGVAVALATLLVAALFNPLRTRFQTLIARTFYRRRYDASHILAAFSVACRDETDLRRLEDRLMHVLNETVHPGHASLWLRKK